MASSSSSLVRCSTVKQCSSETFIYLRGEIDWWDDEEDKHWCIMLVPVSMLYNQNQISNKNKNKNKNENLNYVFNHSLHHPTPFHLNLPHLAVPPKFSALFNASWVALGSTIYFFGAIGSKIFYSKRKFGGSTSPSSIKFRTAGHMINARKGPKLVALEDKIYVFGRGLDCLYKDTYCEVFELYSGSFKGHSRPISSPFPSTDHCDILFAVAMENEKKIVVGWSYSIMDEEVVNLLFPEQPTSGTAIFVYDTIDNSWVKHKNNLFVNPNGLNCVPIIVGSCLFWISSKLWAYDLESRQYYEGPIEDCFFQYVLDNSEDVDFFVSLFHLAGDLFRLTWGSDVDSKVVHCSVIQVTRTTCILQANRYKLCASVVSCQTFALSLSVIFGNSALIL